MRPARRRRMVLAWATKEGPVRGYVMDRYGDATAMTLRDVRDPGGRNGRSPHPGPRRRPEPDRLQGPAGQDADAQPAGPAAGRRERTGRRRAGHGSGGHHLRRGGPGVRPGGQVEAGGVRRLRGGQRAPGREDARRAGLRPGRRPASDRPDRDAGPARRAWRGPGRPAVHLRGCGRGRHDGDSARQMDGSRGGDDRLGPWGSARPPPGRRPGHRLHPAKSPGRPARLRRRLRPDRRRGPDRRLRHREGGRQGRLHRRFS